VPARKAVNPEESKKALEEAMKAAGIQEEEAKKQEEQEEQQQPVADSHKHQRGGLMGLLMPSQLQQAAAAADGEPHKQRMGLMGLLQPKQQQPDAHKRQGGLLRLFKTPNQQAQQQQQQQQPPKQAQPAAAAKAPTAGSSSSAAQGDADPLAVTHKVEMNITVDGKPAGKVVLGLFGNTAPKTVQNVSLLLLLRWYELPVRWQRVASGCAGLLGSMALQPSSQPTCSLPG
jgi:hypothetical protein